MNPCARAQHLVVLLTALAVSGCVSAKYKSAPKDTSPATVLNLTAAQPPVEAIVHSVIVYRGPGSWKREASCVRHSGCFGCAEEFLADFECAGARV